MKEIFVKWVPGTNATRDLLGSALVVVEEYEAQGYQLTLRQLFYQCVARDLIPNTLRWYKRLGEVVVKARLAGFIDWQSIVDRGRTPVMPSHWDGPLDLIDSAVAAYRLDRWAGQTFHVEVWCEKDALSGVLEPVCRLYHVRYLALRGYSSISAIYDGSKRFRAARIEGKRPVVVYLGDHDPSGIDMTRDVTDRLDTLTHQEGVDVRRVALNMDQIETYDPPSNPTKVGDSRSSDYIEKYGHESWELDALEPQVLDGLVSGAIFDFLDRPLYDMVVEQEEQDKRDIRKATDGLR